MSGAQDHEPPRDRVDFGAPRSGSALGGLHWRQLALFVAAGVWGVAWTRTGGGAIATTLGGLGAVMLAGAGLLRPGGRLAIDWGAVGLTFAARRATRRSRYRHRRAGAGRRLPAHLSGIRILEAETDRGSVGLVRDGGRLVVLLQVTPEPILLAGAAEVAGRRAAWGAALASLARPGAGVDRVQWVARLAVVGPVARSHHVDPALRPHLTEPSVLSYLEVVDRIADSATEYVLTIALGVGARRRPADVAAQDALDAASELSEQLAAADLGLARLLDATEVSALLRGAGDPAAPEPFATSADAAGPVPVDPSDPGPMATEEHWDAIRCDGTWHASFWISQWPRGELDAELLAPLVLAGRPGRTVTVVMAPRDPVRAVRDAEHSRVRHAADEELRERAGFVGTVRRRRQQAAISAQERELADGHAAYRFAGYVTVSAATRDELEERCRELAASAPLARCEVRRLWGEQAAGLAACVPLCRGL